MPYGAHAQKGGYKKTHTVDVRIIQCMPDDGLPEGLPGIPKAQKHPACAQFAAHTIAEFNLKLKPGKKKKWAEVKTIPIQGHGYKTVFKDGAFKIVRQTEKSLELKSGVEAEVYLSKATRKKAVLALSVRHLDVQTNGEEVLLHSNGAVHLNPQAHQVERLSVFKIETPLHEEEIWGGENILRVPAAENVPKVYPEHGRLWAEVRISR